MTELFKFIELLKIEINDLNNVFESDIFKEKET